MRKVTAGLFHSVDGVVESPNLWQGDAFDAELGAGMGEFMAATTAAILGRRGYQEWAGYWPHADDPFAQFINPLPKHVASRTLTGPLEWENAALIEGDLHAFVRELKAGDGGDIAVMGGIDIVRDLFLAGLIDELQLMTHPVVAGAGRHLFRPEDPLTRLELVRSVTTSRGNLLATYRLRDA